MQPGTQLHLTYLCFVCLVWSWGAQLSLLDQLLKCHGVCMSLSTYNLHLQPALVHSGEEKSGNCGSGLNPALNSEYLARQMMVLWNALLNYRGWVWSWHELCCSRTCRWLGKLVRWNPSQLQVKFSVIYPGFKNLSQTNQFWMFSCAFYLCLASYVYFSQVRKAHEQGEWTEGTSACGKLSFPVSNDNNNSGNNNFYFCSHSGG